MYEVYEPRIYERANGGADADQEGRPIDLDAFYVASSPEWDGGEIVAGPFATADAALDVVDEIASAAYRKAVTTAKNDRSLPTLMSSVAAEAINRSMDTFYHLVASFRKAHQLSLRG